MPSDAKKEKKRKKEKKEKSPSASPSASPVIRPDDPDDLGAVRTISDLGVSERLDNRLTSSLKKKQLTAFSKWSAHTHAAPPSAHERSSQDVDPLSPQAGPQKHTADPATQSDDDAADGAPAEDADGSSKKKRKGGRRGGKAEARRRKREQKESGEKDGDEKEGGAVIAQQRRAQEKGSDSSTKEPSDSSPSKPSKRKRDKQPAAAEPVTAVSTNPLEAHLKALGHGHVAAPKPAKKSKLSPAAVITAPKAPKAVKKRSTPEGDDSKTMFKGRPKKRSRQKNIKKDTRSEGQRPTFLTPGSADYKPNARREVKEKKKA